MVFDRVIQGASRVKWAFVIDQIAHELLMSLRTHISHIQLPYNYCYSDSKIDLYSLEIELYIDKMLSQQKAG